MSWPCSKKPPWKQLAGYLREQVRDMRRREHRLEQRLKGAHWTNDALNEQNEQLREQNEALRFQRDDKSREDRIAYLERANKALAERVRELEAEPIARAAKLVDWPSAMRRAEDGQYLPRDVLELANVVLGHFDRQQAKP